MKPVNGQLVQWVVKLGILSRLPVEMPGHYVGTREVQSSGDFRGYLMLAKKYCDLFKFFNYREMKKIKNTELHVL